MIWRLYIFGSIFATAGTALVDGTKGFLFAVAFFVLLAAFIMAVTKDI